MNKKRIQHAPTEEPKESPTLRRGIPDERLTASSGSALLYSRRGNGAEKDSKETLAEALRLSVASAAFLERVVKDSRERLIFMVLIKTSCRKRPVRSFTGSADFNR